VAYAEYFRGGGKI